MVAPSIMKQRQGLNIPPGKPVIRVGISGRAENNFAALAIAPVTTKAVASNIADLSINVTNKTTVRFARIGMADSIISLRAIVAPRLLMCTNILATKELGNRGQAIANITIEDIIAVTDDGAEVFGPSVRSLDAPFG